MDNLEDIKRLIAQTENEKVEFKVESPVLLQRSSLLSRRKCDIHHAASDI